MTRSGTLDSLRGLAIVWMVAFHFCFDLNHFGLIDPRQSFYEDPFWTGQRTVIVTLFLFCAGWGQHLAVANGQDWARFWRRWAQVVICAALVSLGSWWMFPRSWISFGVLHGMALMLPLTRWMLLRHARLLLPAALLTLALPSLVSHPWFDTRWTNWVGLVTTKPVTEDWVPWAPWWGVMALGAASSMAFRLDGVAFEQRFLCMVGRWPLSVYMLHQPILMAALLAWVH